MSRPRHELIVYMSNGKVVRQPWRVQGARGYIKRDGPATDAGLEEFISKRQHEGTITIERAIIVKGFKSVAEYLRDTLPTNTQERVIERIIASARPTITQAFCHPQANGDVVLKSYTATGQRPDTIVYRHPTIRELIYGE